MRRAINDLVMAEVFLFQATLESAAVIGEGFSEIGRQVSSEDDIVDAGSLQAELQRIAGRALEPYTSRMKYLRALRDDAG